MRLSLGFSPCPNDTFMFDGMIHGKVDTEGLVFDYVLADIEQLNRRALAHDLDITKVSYHAYAYCRSMYRVLDSGSALGKGCGPILIAKHPMSQPELLSRPIAVPGLLTTANFLLHYFAGPSVQTESMVFSNIESAILSDHVRAGVIIHENRFTYEKKGLHKIQDLGQYWEDSTGLPIPLGAIAIKRFLGDDLADTVNRVLRRSIAFALSESHSVLPFVRLHAQEMAEEVIQAHIALYVNDYSLNLGVEGQLAVSRFLSESKRLKLQGRLKYA